MTEKTFRRNLAVLGYRLHKHGDLYDLIDIKLNALVVENRMLSEVAEHVALLIGFPKID